MTNRKLIGHILLEKKLVTEDQVKEAMDLQKTSGKPLGNLLVELGYITSHLITEALNLVQKREEQLAQLLNVSSDMIKEMELTSLLKYTMDEATKIIDADRCTLYLIDEKTNELRSFITHRVEVQEIRLPLGKGIAGFVAKTGEMVNLEDAYKSPLFNPQIDERTGYRTRTVLCIPLKDRNSKIIGALQALNKKGDGIFTFNDEWLFKSYCICASNAISVVLSDEGADSVSKATQNMERLSLTVENIPDGVIMINKEEDSVVVNPAARWMLGLEINKTLNRKNTIARLEELGIVSVSKWLEGDTENLPSQEITTRLPEVRVLKIDFSDIEGHSKENTRKGFVAVLKDITKEKEIEKIKSDFIAIASHELLSPITSMKNAVNIMLQGILGTNTKSQERFLHIISDGVEYISYLATTLMDIALLESRKIILRKEKVDLCKVIRSSVDSVRFKAEENKISILNKDGNVPPVLADSNRVRQTLLNLLDNALKFTPHGGEIIVDAKITEEEVEIGVKDNGPGILLEEQDKIFERFYQIENAATKKHYGMGLGLSICKDIVEAHGGRIWVESKEIGGSNFVFTLPLFK